jgi:hypothetical protein
MQIPAGWSRQGSAGKMTNGEWHHPVAHQGPAQRLKSATKSLARLFCGHGPVQTTIQATPGDFRGISSPGIEGHSKLMGLDRGCTDGSLQRLGNFGNADFLFCQRFQFTHIGWGPRAPNGLFLLGHNGSSFYEASFYHTKKN